MASTLTNIVAAKKLDSIKRNYKVAADSLKEPSPETQRKLQEKVEKDAEKREKNRQKREEMYEERNRQREKLRNKIKDKYGLHKDEDSDKDDKKKKSSKKTKQLKEKDFYKYNKAMPDEVGKKAEREQTDSGKGATFATMSEGLAKKADEEEKKSDCAVM